MGTAPATNNATINTCAGTFLDSGGAGTGAGAQYGNNQNFTNTFCSSTPGQCLQVVFTVFNTEEGLDFLRIYDGNSAAAPQVANLNGNLNATLPTIISSTGCLTFVFTSDGSVTAAGWSATISCVPCPAIPSNNLICNATAVICGSAVNGTTQAATNLGTGEVQTCGVAQALPGVWYSIVGNGQLMTASLCATGWDSRVEVFSSTAGNCNAVTCVGGNNNGGPSCAGNSASYSWTSVVGTTYYILVSGSVAPSSFSFVINCAAAPPSPVNDNPCNATPLNVGTTCSFTQYTNANATGTAGVANPTCSSYLGGDVWFTAVVPTSGNLTIDSNTGVVLDGGIAVYTGTCAALTQVACDDDSSLNGAMSLVTLNALTPGSTVFIRFWEYGNNNNGTFSICAFEPAPPPPPPANDLVCNASPIACGQTLAGSTINATLGGPGEGVTCGAITPTSPGVWYVVPGGGQIMTASLCGTAAWDSYIQVYSGADCNSLNCVDGIDDNGPACLGLAASVAWNAQVGLNYYIFVSGLFSNSDFNLSLACVTPPPPIITCNGTFTDSGGAVGVYGPSETQIYTYCPGITGGRVRMNFTQFDLEDNADFLTIYDGASTSAPTLGTYTGLVGPGILEATLTNGTGCLTFVFQSNDIIETPGWSADITCIQPCQTIVSNLISTSPSAQGDGIIRICQGQQVTFNGSGTFSQSGTGATYNWSFGDGVPINGASVTQAFATAGTYIANLNIEDTNGCLNTNRLNVIVQVSTTPVISPIITPNPICLGQSATGSSSVAMTPFIQNCTPPISGTTFLPDGTGVSYQTSIAVDCYTSNQVVAAASDIQNICLNLEHSYLGDLNLAIVCPNGQSAILKSYPGGGGTYLGCPLDDPAVGPGTGAQYCFNSTATTLLVNAPNAPANCGTPAGLTKLAGTYQPVQPFTNLIGCPLNGQWTIQVTDNLGADNGYLFNWDINFNPALLPPTSQTSFTPTITSQGWQAASGLTTAAGSTSATVSPTVNGNNCYTYSVTDNFGCTYNQQACVNVSSSASAVLTSAAATANQTVCLNSPIAGIQYTLTGATTATVSPLPTGVNFSIVGNLLTISGTPTQSGTFTYHVVGGAVGCGFDVTGTIIVNPAISLNITTTNPSCPSACNGTANVLVTGGAAPYTYTWSGPSAASGPNPTNLCVGIYTVTVTGGGCTSQSAAPIPTSCFEIQSILVDACGTPENVGEMVFFQVGPAGLNTSSLGLTWATATQPYNGLCTNPTFISNVNATITGGGSLVAAPAVLPPGANVVLITGNTATTSANLFTNLSSTLYVLFQCTQSSTAGHFGNGNGTGLRTFTMNFGAGCSDQVTYMAESLIGVDGASVVYSASGTPSYINTVCNAPFLPPTTGTIVLTSATPDVQVIASTTSICSGGSASLTATGATSYTWAPATGLSATTGASVTATPTVTTTYTVTGTTGTCVESAPVTITVGTQPTATISYPAASFCTSVTAAQAVTITGASGGTFSAPAGLTINASTGAITPSTSTAGSYLVTYTIPATPTCPVGTATVTVAINAVPTVTGTIGNATPCSGPDLATAANANVSLTSPQAGTVFNWSMYAGATATGAIVEAGTGSPITNPIPNNTCNVAPYTYQITPTLNGCQGNPISLTVNVRPKPISSFTISPNPICVGQTATLNYTGPICPTSTYNWEGRLSPSTTWSTLAAAGLNPSATNSASFTVAPSTSGTYQIRVQSTIISGCTGQMSTPIIDLVVNPIPTATITGPAAVCSGNSTSLNLTSTPAGATFNWTQTAINASGASNGLGTTIAQTLTATGASAGSVQYAVTPTLNGCIGPAVNSTVIVNIPPTATTTAGSLCPGTSSSFTINATAGAALSWSNSLGGSGTITTVAGGNNIFGPSSVGLGSTWPSGATITFNQIALNGCITPLNIVISVTSNINATATAVSPVCSGTTSLLTLTGTPSATVTYNVGGVVNVVNLGPTGTTTATTPVLTSNTNVAVTLVQISGGCSQVLNNVTPIVVTPLNTASAPSASPTVCPGSALTPITITTTGATGIGAVTGLPSGLSASWNSNVITISGTPTVPGTYSYNIALAGGCGPVSASGTITVSDVLDFANLQFPAIGTICTTSSFSAYGQIFNTGTIATAPAGAAAGVTAQIGYSTTNTDPATWTNWSSATFNIQSVNNDEYTGVLSGLAPGTYYYAFRFQINGCAWQYGGYSATGGGFWGGANVNGVLTVDGLPNAGVDGAVSVCASGTPVALFNSLSGSPANTGSWTGPSGLDNGSLGTYDPLTDNPGAYTYTVQTTLNICPEDVAIVTVTETLSPQASIAYASPICASVTAIQSPTVVGAPGGTFSALPAGLGITAAGTFNPTTATPGTYTVTYSVAAANGCAAFQTQAVVVIQAAPAIPTLAPANPCAIRDSVFTAGGGSWYEFFVNGVSVGPASAVGVLDTTALAGGTQVCVRSYPVPPIMDGNLTDPSWTPVIPGTTGGPTSQAPFTVADTRLDGLKMLNRNGRLYIGVAGNEIDGTLMTENNRILLFIDSKTGGFNSLSTWINRSNADPFTFGVRNLDGGITFDAGFEPDYILSINRANLVGSTTFYDLYDMTTNTNTFLGSSPGVQFGYQESFTDNDLTRGFELYVPLASIGNPVSLKVFGMLINDPGANAATLVSNQFFSVANAGDNNYGSGAISFPNAAPNAIVYQVTQDCFEERCVTISQSVTPTFTTPAPICQGNTAPTLPTASTNVPPVTGTWTGPVSNQASGTYTFTPAAGQCAGGAQIGVVVNPTPATDGIYHD